jgi:hypothetical protein
LAAARVEGTAATQGGAFSQSLDHDPSLEKIMAGTVNRAPRFYARYSGPKRPDLHVLGANGRFLPGRGYVFVGETVGKISSSQSSFYVFGINRGGASGPGPFPDRPMIIFDAEIIVATSPDGYTATVELLNKKGQPTSSTSLTEPAIVFSNNDVGVIVPSALLPSTSPPGTAPRAERYSFAFWAGTSPSAPGKIAGFAPVYANATVE